VAILPLFFFPTFLVCAKTTHEIDYDYEREIAKKSHHSTIFLRLLIFAVGLVLINFYGRRIGNELLLPY
jgi:hypothetical protein